MLVTPPYFVATKLEAFIGRGGGDYLMSHDLEDAVAVIDGNPDFPQQVQACAVELREYLAGRFQELLDDSAFRQALPGYLPSDIASQAGLPSLLQRLEELF